MLEHHTNILPGTMQWLEFTLPRGSAGHRPSVRQMPPLRSFSAAVTAPAPSRGASVRRRL